MVRAIVLDVALHSRRDTVVSAGEPAERIGMMRRRPGFHSSRRSLENIRFQGLLGGGA